MKPGDMVGWKFNIDVGFSSELGIIVRRFALEHEPWPHWEVLFNHDRGLLRCRESDLMVIE